MDKEKYAYTICVILNNDRWLLSVIRFALDALFIKDFKAGRDLELENQIIPEITKILDEKFELNFNDMLTVTQ